MEFVNIKKTDSDEKRIVYGEVYAPDRPDSQGEFMRAEDIEKMAHDFMRRMKTQAIDTEHNNKLVQNTCVVECFIAREGDPTFIPGSWVVGVHIDDDDTWAKVKKGEINGFSLEAYLKYEEVEVELEIPPVVSGRTSKSDDHEHEFHVAYDENGVFLGGKTDEVDGHFHVIKKGTVCEPANGHSHTFSAVDLVKVK